tara:strand:+ start:4380 stop:7670 length:3291 start_codon:yes stop_codon:yes gene_type:complete
MAFGKFRHATIKGEKGSDWNIEIWKSGFSGSSTEFKMEGEGFEITWNGQGGTRQASFLGSACTINFLVLNDDDESFTYDTIAQGFKYYYVRIYRGAVSDANLWWFGWLQPSFDVIENTPYPYTYKLTASDSYGYINKLKSKFFTNNTAKNGNSTIQSSLSNVFARLTSTSYIPDADVGGSTADNLTPNPDNRKFIRMVSDWWRDGETYSTTVNPLSKVYISQGAYAEKTQFQTDEFGNVTTSNSNNPLEYKIQDSFNGTLRLFNLVGFLAEGFYNFIQPNTYIGNASASLNAFEIAEATSTASVQNSIASTLLTIDQTTNVILGGSTITFDPSIESVNLTFDEAEESFLVAPETDLEGTDVNAGILVISGGVLSINFIVQNEIRVTKADFSDGSGNNVTSSSYLNTCSLTIKLSNGTTDYYLQTDGATNSKLKWTASGTPLTIDVKRGYAASQFASNPLNNSDVVDTGIPISNSNVFTPNFVQLPCHKYAVSGTISGFQTLIRFSCQIDEAPISGEVTIKTTTTNDYSQESSGDIIAINDPTPIYNKTKVIELGVIPTEQNNLSNASQKITYSSSQTATPSLESVDLGSVPIGQTAVNALYSVKYLSGSQILPITTNFRRGSSGSPSNLLQLVVNEYLEMQTKPLEVLQADIQSPTISPLKIISYSINADGNSKQYKFLGGTFKGKSEILSGEWYKVAESGASITDDNPTTSTEFTFNPGNNLLNQLSNFTALNNQKINEVIAGDKLGVIDTTYNAGVAITSISLGSNLIGDINDNQLFKICYPDGSNERTLTSNANHTTSSNTLSIDSFTPSVTYFSGCFIKPSIEAFTTAANAREASPAGSDGNIQYNDAGALGAESDFTYNRSTNTLSVDNIAVSDIDLTSVAGQSLTITAGIYDNPVTIVGGDSKVYTRYQDNGTTGTNLIGVGAIGDDTYFRNDEGSFKFYVANDATVGAELKQSGNFELNGFIIPNISSIKILPRDFIADDGGRPLGIDDTGSTRFLESFSTNKMYASVEIPRGFKATRLDIYGDSTSAVTVYEANINSSTVTSKGTGNVGTAITFTSNVDSSATNYLLIELDQTSTEKIYGGTIAISKI